MRHLVLWPERRFVSTEQLITWAADDVENGEHPGPVPDSLPEALLILQDTGSVTLAAEVHGEC